MAPPAGTLRVGRYFLALAAILALLYSIVAFGSRHTPKLGLDLVGGVRVIFTAVTPKGSPPPTGDQMTQARQILEDRINTTGVTGSTVVVQGSDQLVVEIPNGTSTDVAALGKAAVLNFRGVVAPAQPVSCTPIHAVTPSGTSASPSTSGNASAGDTGSASASGSASSSAAPSSSSDTASHSPGVAGFRRLPEQAPASSITGTAPAKSAPAKSAPAKSAPAKSAPAGSATPATGSGSGSAAAPSSTGSASAAAPARCLVDPFKRIFAADPKLKAKMPNAESCPSPGIADNLCKPYTALTDTQKQEVSAALANLDCGSTQLEPDVPDSYYYACDAGTTYGTKVAYLLGHVVVPGSLIDSAAAQAPNSQSGQFDWTVALTLTGKGGDRWHAWTSKYNTADTNASVLSGAGGTACAAGSSVPCSDFVGFTLDGVVISAPVTQAVLDINTSVSGNFDQTSATDLARELNYGKLPVSFRTEAIQEVSATLGTKQLNAALLAGGIGLILVVLYSLIYYRGLGLVTIASLLVSAVLTYAMLVILGKQIGFTLDLAGIAGFIVALGITADSFVVFFERLKDEVHEGRSVRVAVPRAWVRARRTILSADTVSFLAAAILYFFASADVKGFAFTLGMSTILDLVVVFLFTHPIVSLLSRSRAFGSPGFTGLNAVRAGVTPIPDSADRPVRRQRPSRTGRGGATAVAVLDEPETATDDVPATDATPDATLGTAPDTTPQSTAGASAQPVDDDGAPAARRRSVPEIGSAAERAAARRARMRNKPRDEGDR